MFLKKNQMQVSVCKHYAKRSDPKIKSSAGEREERSDGPDN